MLRWCSGFICFLSLTRQDQLTLQGRSRSGLIRLGLASSAPTPCRIQSFRSTAEAELQSKHALGQDQLEFRVAKLALRASTSESAAGRAAGLTELAQET